MDGLCAAYAEARAVLQESGPDHLVARPLDDERRIELVVLVRDLPPAEECSEQECKFALRSLSASHL